MNDNIFTDKFFKPLFEANNSVVPSKMKFA